MKKIICTVLLLCSLSFILTGCTADDFKNFDAKSFDLSKIFRTWEDEAKEQLPEKMEEASISQIYLDGKVYSFPIKTSELLDDGWTMVNVGDHYEGTDISPNFVTEETLMSSPSKKDTITVTFYNNTTETIMIKDTIIETLIVDNQFSKALLPGGLKLGDEKDSLDELLADWGPMFEKTEDGNGYFSDYIAYFDSEQEYPCSLTAEVISNNIYYVDKVTYYIESSLSNLANQDELVQAEFDLLLHKNLDQYSEVMGEIEDGENRDYMESSRETMVDDFVSYAGFEFDDLNTIERDQLLDYLDDVLMSTKFTVTKNDDKLYVEYTYPNMDDQISDAVSIAYNAYYEKNGESSNLATDREFFGYFVKALNAVSYDVTYGSDSVEYTMENNYISDDDYFDLWDRLMGYKFDE